MPRNNQRSKSAPMCNVQIETFMPFINNYQATNQVKKWLAGAIINIEFNENIMVSWKAFKRYLKYVQCGAGGGEEKRWAGSNTV